MFTLASALSTVSPAIVKPAVVTAQSVVTSISPLLVPSVSTVIDTPISSPVFIPDTYVPLPTVILSPSLSFGLPEGMEQGQSEGIDQGLPEGVDYMSDDNETVRLATLSDYAVPQTNGVSAGVSAAAATTLQPTGSDNMDLTPEQRSFLATTLKVVPPPNTPQTSVTDLNAYRAQQQQKKMILYAVIAAVVGLVTYFMFFRKTKAE